jgi:hypothetical protein
MRGSGNVKNLISPMIKNQPKRLPYQRVIVENDCTKSHVPRQLAIHFRLAVHLCKRLTNSAPSTPRRPLQNRFQSIECHGISAAADYIFMAVPNTKVLGHLAHTCGKYRINIHTLG